MNIAYTDSEALSRCLFICYLNSIPYAWVVVAILNRKCKWVVKRKNENVTEKWTTLFFYQIYWPLVLFILTIEAIGRRNLFDGITPKQYD